MVAPKRAIKWLLGAVTVSAAFALLWIGGWQPTWELFSAGLCWRTGRLEDSARGYEEVLELARTRGQRSHEAAALASLSVVYRDPRCRVAAHRLRIINIIRSIYRNIAGSNSWTTWARSSGSLAL